MASFPGGFPGKEYKMWQFPGHNNGQQTKSKKIPKKPSKGEIDGGLIFRGQWGFSLRNLHMGGSEKQKNEKY